MVKIIPILLAFPLLAWGGEIDPNLANQITYKNLSNLFNEGREPKQKEMVGTWDPVAVNINGVQRSSGLFFEQRYYSITFTGTEDGNLVVNSYPFDYFDERDADVNFSQGMIRMVVSKDLQIRLNCKISTNLNFLNDLLCARTKTQRGKTVTDSFEIYKKT